MNRLSFIKSSLAATVLSILPRFVREKKMYCFVNLYPGRSATKCEVSKIIHLQSIYSLLPEHPEFCLVEAIHPEHNGVERMKVFLRKSDIFAEYSKNYKLGTIEKEHLLSEYV